MREEDIEAVVESGERLPTEMWEPGMPDMDDWFLVAWDWNRADPPHAHAVLRLLDAVNASAEASV